jgi:tRNA1Val (adenine37-N6)-methyltransferase
MNDRLRWVQPGERLDDLQLNDLHLIQDPESFCFGVDAVLLSHFARPKKGSTVIDLGTGSGVIPILLAGRHPHCRITGVELQPDMAERAGRSVAMNNLTERVRILQADIRNIREILPAASFDVVTSNPPYLPAGSLLNPRETIALARHEIALTLEELMTQAAYLLKPGGQFYLIHRPQRLTDIFVLGRQYLLEPKWMQTVHSFVQKPPAMVLLQLSKNGRPELKSHPPLVIYNPDGTYTPELLRCYHK